METLLRIESNKNVASVDCNAAVDSFASRASWRLAERGDGFDAEVAAPLSTGSACGVTSALIDASPRGRLAAKAATGRLQSLNLGTPQSRLEEQMPSKHSRRRRKRTRANASAQFASPIARSAVEGTDTVAAGLPQPTPTVTELSSPIVPFAKDSASAPAGMSDREWPALPRGRGQPVRASPTVLSLSGAAQVAVGASKLVRGVGAGSVGIASGGGSRSLAHVAHAAAQHRDVTRHAHTQIGVVRGAASQRGCLDSAPVSTAATIASEGAEHEAAVIRRVRAACAWALQEASIRSHKMRTSDARVDILFRIGGRIQPGQPLWKGVVSVFACFHSWLDLTHGSDADTHPFE
eukprot:TRINITY_DN9861_c0_g2_i1.p1 TRINITY_DN9861_c0_g2~~TRINITY_DN9861_c0_g2_i1.p1  ORF type:complete len:398 (-),score=48.57 TRINITY_DN9861_c0_g2_i1:110-1159(-)